jgi:polygalacturonase
MNRGTLIVLIVLALMSVVAPLFAASVYPQRLEDPEAVYLTPDHFPVRADGKADDSAAIQQAIDRVQDTTGQGIVFIPSGRYPSHQGARGRTHSRSR